MLKYLKLILLLLPFISMISFADPINILAAENFYGSLAKTIGGKYVKVKSVLNNPNADPHLFVTSVSASKLLDKAQIIIYNGMDYDTWINNLLTANSNNKNIIIINVADLVGIKNKGANPHIWYKPSTFPILAKKLTSVFLKIENSKDAKNYFKENLNNFLKKNKQVQEKIQQIIKQTKESIAVSATEPVFGYMIDALNFKNLGSDVQWKIMNDSDPSPQMLAQYQNNIIDKKIKILFYNNQVASPITENILKLARLHNIKIVGISETQPNDESVNNWLLSALNDTQNALNNQ